MFPTAILVYVFTIFHLFRCSRADYTNFMFATLPLRIAIHDNPPSCRCDIYPIFTFSVWNSLGRAHCSYQIPDAEAQTDLRINYIYQEGYISLTIIIEACGVVRPSPSQSYLQKPSVHGTLQSFRPDTSRGIRTTEMRERIIK